MKRMTKACGAVLFLSAALAAGCAGSSRVRLAGDRPRLFIRPAEGQGTLSLEALRRRVKAVRTRSRKALRCARGQIGYSRCMRSTTAESMRGTGTKQ